METTLNQASTFMYPYQFRNLINHFDFNLFYGLSRFSEFNKRTLIHSRVELLLIQSLLSQVQMPY